MKFFLPFFILTIQFFYIFSSYAQVIDSSEKNNRELKFARQVKLLDEFFVRFNQDNQAEVNAVSESVTAGFTRSEVLQSLFDYSYYKANQEMVDRFIAQIVTNNATLDFYSENWYAQLNSRILYFSEIKDIELILVNEKVAKDVSKWVILDVFAGFLKIQPTDTTAYLQPMAHEANFVSLNKVFEHNQNIAQYAHRLFVPNRLSIFFWLVKNNFIQYKQTLSVTYHFQIENWSFKVKNFNRADFNSGWLIAELSEIKTKKNK